MTVIRALGDVNRVRALLALREGELCVCEIIALLELAPSTVSKHMSILRQAGLVEATKRGRWVYYRLPMENQASALVADTVSFVLAALSHDPTTLRDAERLRVLLEEHPQELCKTRSLT